MASGQLESILGLRFKDRQLLEQAMVHRSYVNEQGWSPADSYERLEYLGDAVLELAVSDELYRRCPQLPEGELTKGRSALVRRETLTQVAKRSGLADFVMLGRGEESTGGRQRDSILAAAFEAVVAAVYLDRGYAEARQFILRTMAQEFREFFCGKIAPENPKSRLQEYVQGQGMPAPRYRLLSSEGPDHGPVFTIEVVVDSQVLGVGHGGSKAGAERTAAEDALARLASHDAETRSD